MMNRTLCFLLLLCAYSTSHVFSQTSVRNRLETKFGSIEIADNVEDWIDSIYVYGNGNYGVYVHLERIPTYIERKTLVGKGIIIGDYIGGKSYEAIVSIKSGNKPILPSIVRGISNVNNDYRVERAVTELLGQKPQRLNLIVSFYLEIPEKKILEYIQNLGGKIVMTGTRVVGVYDISIPASAFDALKSYYAVKSISLSQTPVSLNYEAKTASKSNLANLPAVYGGFGLKGRGVTVGIGDNSTGLSHVDLKDRIINYNPQMYANHGVHINGITGGAGIVNPKGEGVAPEAGFINHLFSGIWQETGAFHDLYNMTITNNSYAAVVKDCNYAGTYNTYSETIDRLSLQYKDVLHVFASGNDGLMTCAPYPTGYATVVGAYQVAKNSLVVTSTDKNYSNATDAGRGPVKDGRLKPEIAAVGVDVMSTVRVDSYLVSGGTSMACPGVAGGLALLTERYRQLKGNINPQADLLKALVLNTATDLGAPGPDYRFGFGFMNVGRALKVLDNTQYIVDNVTNIGQKSYSINVPTNTAQLKVMLLWFDVPASAASTKQLVNDLDIEVVTPALVTHKPLILDSSPSNILNIAIEGDDRLNNTEQVVINNPQSGQYVINIKGYNVPSSSQNFILVYDFVEQGIAVTYPTTGAQVAAGDSLRIYWDASSSKHTQHLEYSIDGGNNWLIVANSIPAEQRQYTWFVPSNISSGKCRIRVVRDVTNEQNSTGQFAITQAPIVELNQVQCPGYISISWAGIQAATGYEVMKNVNGKMLVVDTTTNNNYVFSGLSQDSAYYVAIRPIVDGLSGYRSLSVKRVPNDGDCTGNISDGDIAVVKLVSPRTGRINTSSSLKNNEVLEVALYNLDDMPVTAFRVNYRINGGVWNTKNYSFSLPANSVSNIKLDTFDFSVPNIYNIDIAVQNLLMVDPVVGNDSLTIVVKQMKNIPITLSAEVVEDFEDWPAITSVNELYGIDIDERWDYTNSNDTCRVRTYVKDDILIAGKKSLSLDAIIYSNNSNRNEFKGTLNLSQYDASKEEIRFEFDYLVHGFFGDEDSNSVFVRGADIQPWTKVFTYDSKVSGTGNVAKSGSISLSDAVLSSIGNFTTSTQVLFMQNDVSLISMRGFGRGITIDNLKLYTVKNDIQLLDIVSPIVSECGLTGLQPLTIKIRNGVNQQLNDVKLYYKLDDNSIVNETLGSIAGKQTLNYTFNNKMDLTKKGRHVLSVWIVGDGDTYLSNDSLLNFEFYNQPLINAYPYFEDFESGDGGWFAKGTKSSWAYGQIVSPQINKAASGKNGWKTNLAGIYNDAERSFLYSPCYDLSGLKNPTLRFKRATDIEYCGSVLCDGAFMEYSPDGINWERLGIWRDGVNWYNDTLYNVWSEENSIEWKSSSIQLPKQISLLRLRYQFISDLGSEREGLAIDDVEVFDDLPVVVENNLLNVVPNPTKDGKVTIDWTAHGGIMMELVVFNIMGKKVYETKSIANEGRNRTTIQTPNFPPGVYLYHILIGDKKYTRKIVHL